jgi:hypothetical protein
MDHRADGGPLIRAAGIAAVAFAAIALAAACDRDPVDVPCPDVLPGDLVITELSAEWVEIYNASARTAELAGAALTLQSVMGGEPDRILIRSQDVTIAAGAYGVIGRTAAEFVDYVYGVDFDDELYENAQIRLEACGVEIDAVVYWGLDDGGTIAYDGNLDPDAAGNDNADVNDTESDWCVDTTGALGTPGARNTACM